MQFSAYQIESMLDDYQEGNFPSDRSASETLSLSEVAINEARQHFTPSANRASVWKSPKKIIELIEDKTAYDLVVDFVQQSRRWILRDIDRGYKSPCPALLNIIHCKIISSFIFNQFNNLFWRFPD